MRDEVLRQESLTFLAVCTYINENGTWECLPGTVFRGACQSDKRSTAENFHLSLGWSSENPSKHISIHDTSIVKTHPAPPMKNMTSSARNPRGISASSIVGGMLLHGKDVVLLPLGT